MSLINVGDTQQFNYTGNIQTLTIEKSALYKLDVYGAKGGGSHTSSIGGNGGHSVGYKYLTANTILYIVCGGTGGSRTGGYNGGGTGGSYYATQGNGGGGGGATHISLVSGLLKDIGKDNFIANGLIVSGGGGGAGSNGRSSSGYSGGSGGGTSGANGTKGSGGTQTSGYAFGQGGNGKNGGNYDYGDNGGGGGGGGFYGGYGASATGKNSDGSGGGGSGWIGGVPTITFGNNTYTPLTENGKNSGNGYAIITLIELPKEVKVTSNPSGGGTFIGDGSFPMGSTTILEAIPNGGYDFVNWNLKGYTQLEYIESSGTQWIDTLYKINSENFSIKITCTQSSVSGLLYGQAVASSPYSNRFDLYSNSTNALQGGLGSSIIQAFTISNDVFTNQINASNGTYTQYIDNVLFDSGSYSGTIVANGNLKIFQDGSNANFTRYKLYEFVMWDNGTLVRDFIPCIRHKDGAIGLLDLCELKFYGNSGSGSFIGGNIL